MKNPFLLFVLSLFSICLQAQTTISSSVSITQADIDGYTWPVTIDGGTISSPVVVTLAEDITIADGSQYFNFESDYIEFNGNSKTTTISSVSDYPGLFHTATGISFISVNNTKVHSNGSTLTGEGGWIGQTSFGNGGSDIVISNCYSDGDTYNFAGGITGSYSSCTVINSHTSGQISYYSGGIFGAYSTGISINCYSTGNMDTYSGGIVGYDGSGNISDCYSTGSIGFYCGGISAFYSFSPVSRCYSTGDITSEGAGGIASSPNYGDITNCYSTGNIISGSGGIAGPGNSGAITNSYTTGAIDDGAYGIADAGTITDCIFEDGGSWNDVNAATALTGTDGSSWTDINRGSSSTPYKLSSFSAVIYSPATENKPDNALITSPAGNFSTGTYSIASINDADPSGYPSVTIDVTSGMISFTNSGIGTFTTEVLYADNSDASYQISDYTLNILSTLPITWRSFTVTPRDNAAWLQWSTSSEQNTRNFNVQHSINGSNWTTISTLTAAGNSAAISNYSYLHAGTVSGNNYYRIQQTDLDGKYSYSSVRQLELASGNKGFSVVNTLVSNGVLQVEVKASSTLYLYNNDGKLLWQKKFNAGLQNIDLGAASKGVYFLKGKDAVEKIVVQ